MAQPSTRFDSSLKLADNVQKDTMADLIRRLKKPSHKSRPYNQRQQYSKHSAELLKSNKPTDPTAVTEGADATFGELPLRKPTSAKKYTCLPCKRAKREVCNILSRCYLRY